MMRDFPEPEAYQGLFLFNETASEVPLSQSVAEKISTSIEEQEACTFVLIEVVFVDADTIREINVEHLSHNYVTDIITFRYDEETDLNAIEGTLYCCVPQIVEQAEEHGEPVEREFRRILIHGLLHLAGYDDKTDAEKKKMRSHENHYLSFL